MANSLTDEDKKLVRSLRNAQLIDKLVYMLERRRDSYNRNLRVCSLDKIQIYQGRAQELDDLIASITTGE